MFRRSEADKRVDTL